MWRKVFQMPITVKFSNYAPSNVCEDFFVETLRLRTLQGKLRWGFSVPTLCLKGARDLRLMVNLLCHCGEKGPGLPTHCASPESGTLWVIQRTVQAEFAPGVISPCGFQCGKGDAVNRESLAATVITRIQDHLFLPLKWLPKSGGIL